MIWQRLAFPWEVLIRKVTYLLQFHISLLYPFPTILSSSFLFSIFRSTSIYVLVDTLRDSDLRCTSWSVGWSRLPAGVEYGLFHGSPNAKLFIAMSLSADVQTISDVWHGYERHISEGRGMNANDIWQVTLGRNQTDTLLTQINRMLSVTNN